MPNPKMSHRTIPVNGEDVTYDIKDAVATSDIADIKAFIGYIEPSVIGLSADFENSTFTRLGDAVGLNAGSDFNKFSMYGNRKLCNLADDGTVNAWYGESGYTEDGSNGQVMVYQPKFYYKVLPLKLEKIAPEVIDPEAATPEYTEPEGYHLLKANYFISDKPKYGFKVHPAFLAPDGVTEMDGIYISAYEGSIYDVSAAKYLIYDDMSDDGNYIPETYIADMTVDKFCSIANVKPASGRWQTDMTRPGVESMCQNRGSKWHSENLQVISMEQLLMIIEYGTFNMQNEIGDGVTNLGNSRESYTVQTGSTSSIGNGSGHADTNVSYILTSDDEILIETYTILDGIDTLSIRYRGRENEWGNICELVNGANVYGNGVKLGGILYYCTDYNYAESKHTDNYVSTAITMANSRGYIQYFGWSSECDWMFIPTNRDGTSTTPVGDYIYIRPNLNKYQIVDVGGYWYNTKMAGPFCMDFSMNVGSRYNNEGGRIMCLGPVSNS